MVKIAIALYYTIACTTPLPPYHMYKKFSTPIFPLPSVPSISGGFQQAMFYLCSEFRGLVKLLLVWRLLYSGAATRSTGVDMCTTLLSEVLPEIDANPGSFFWGGASVTFGAWPTSLRNTENEANLLLRLGIQKMKGFQLKNNPRFFAVWYQFFLTLHIWSCIEYYLRYQLIQGAAKYRLHR